MITSGLEISWFRLILFMLWIPQWRPSWSYGRWIYNYQCLSPLKLWVRTPLMGRCTRLCNRACQ